jgi:hypothetical protein
VVVRGAAARAAERRCNGGAIGGRIEHNIWRFAAAGLNVAQRTLPPGRPW